jgi:hypothetical protein
VSTASDLYLRNQAEFEHDSSLLTPYFVLSFAGLVGSAAFTPFRQYRWVRLLLWSHILAAPWFILFHVLQTWSLGAYFFRWLLALPIGTASLTLTYLGSAFLLERSSRTHLESIVLPVAAFSAILLGTEFFIFVHSYETPSRRSAEIRLPDTYEVPPRPNIYHLVLDGYQTDLFEMALSGEIRDALVGFVYYPKALALYGDTKDSVPSFLTGQMRPEGMSSDAFLLHGLGSRDSFLYWLKKSGYATLAYLPPLYRVGTRLFDERIFHSENGRSEEVRALNHDTFLRLWAYSNLPRPVTDALLGSSWFVVNEGDDLAQIERDRFLPRSAPVRSYFSFLNALEQEALLPNRNRYTLNHLLIPHVPEVLHADCSFDPSKPVSGPLPQARCATRILVRFVERLKQLDRFDDALVVIHADHGEYYRVDNDAVHPSDDISLRVLMLVKPPRRREPFTVSEREVTLLSLAPTILEIAGIKDGPAFASPVLSEVLEDAESVAANH